MVNEQQILIPYELRTFLNDIVDSKFGYRLGDPWKYNEDALGVVVPILREMTTERHYVTMYEVLDQLKMKDTGNINQVELQNNCGKAIFVRAGTIFAGKTQNRAAQHSGVYQEKDTNIKVSCVYQTHGIRQGAEMKFGDIAPPSVTMNLMTGNQSKVWESVHRFTSGTANFTNETINFSNDTNITAPTPPDITNSSENLRRAFESIQRYQNWSGVNCEVRAASDGTVRISRVKPSEDITQIWRGSLSGQEFNELSKYANDITSQARNSRTRTYGFMPTTSTSSSSSSLGSNTYNIEMGIFNSIGSSLNNFQRNETSPDNLLEHLQKIKGGQSLLDDMMQRVPLFANQVGAIIFNPVGVIAIETFDHPKSWESIKKEIIEKFGDKIKNEQAEHLFELKKDMILPILKKFISKLDKFTEKIIRKDNFSETREVSGEGIIGEYTIVKGQPIHVLLLRTN